MIDGDSRMPVRASGIAVCAVSALSWLRWR
jgi:hypothetical protein